MSSRIDFHFSLQLFIFLGATLVDRGKSENLNLEVVAQRVVLFLGLHNRKLHGTRREMPNGKYEVNW